MGTATLSSPQSFLSEEQLSEWFRVNVAEGKRNFLMWSAIYWIERYRLRGQVEPEDLVEDVLFRAWTNISSFDSAKGTLDKWLGTILINLAKNHVRDISRRMKKVPLATSSDSTYRLYKNAPSNRSSGLSELIFQERREALMRAIKKLPHNQRQVILGRLNGVSYKELARTLDTNEGTIKSRLNRAKGALREDQELKGLVETDNI